MPSICWQNYGQQTYNDERKQLGTPSAVCQEHLPKPIVHLMVWLHFHDRFSRLNLFYLPLPSHQEVHQA
jgi:hypothetical protein